MGVKGQVEAVKPCERAFRAERALPSGAPGPAWAALERLSARCFSEMGDWGAKVSSDFRDSMESGRVCHEAGQVVGKKGFIL